MRTPKIVDTNVCVTSNGKSGASIACASKCANELLLVTRKGQLVLDADDVVLEEYKKHLSFSGQPGAGDAFFKWLVDNRYKQDRVLHLALTPHPTRAGDFALFPDTDELAGFHVKDRVFVALSIGHPGNPPILTAVDSDYWHFREPLQTHGAQVVHICGSAHYKPKDP